DKDMVVPGKAFFRKGRPQQLAKAPFHPVADHGVADLLGNGDAEALAQPIVRPGQQYEPDARVTQAPVGREEVRPLADDGDGINRHDADVEAESGCDQRPASANARPQVPRSVAKGLAPRTSARRGARKASYALSFLRPRARRARRILRPPTVAL